MPAKRTLPNPQPIDTLLGVWVTAADREVVRRAAAYDALSSSAYVRRVLRQHLRDQGLID